MECKPNLWAVTPICSFGPACILSHLYVLVPLTHPCPPLPSFVGAVNTHLFVHASTCLFVLIRCHMHTLPFLHICPIFLCACACTVISTCLHPFIPLIPCLPMPLFMPNHTCSFRLVVICVHPCPHSPTCIHSQPLALTVIIVPVTTYK